MRKQGCKTVFPLVSPENLSRTYTDVQVTSENNDAVLI